MKNYSMKNFLMDSLWLLLIISFGAVYFTAEPTSARDTRQATRDTIYVKDTIYLDVPASSNTEKVATTPIISTTTVTLGLHENHCDYYMLDSLCKYPLYALTSVILESGDIDHKAELADVVNNNIGMMVSLGRFHQATLADTAEITKQLGLTFGREYDLYKVKGKVVKNKRGEICIGYKHSQGDEYKWGIYLSPVNCARDKAEYQSTINASSPREYLAALKRRGYFTSTDEANGYSSKWLRLYNQLKLQYQNENTEHIAEHSND